MRSLSVGECPVHSLSRCRPPHPKRHIRRKTRSQPGSAMAPFTRVQPWGRLSPPQPKHPMPGQLAAFRRNLPGTGHRLTGCAPKQAAQISRTERDRGYSPAFVSICGPSCAPTWWCNSVASAALHIRHTSVLFQQSLHDVRPVAVSSLSALEAVPPTRPDVVSTVAYPKLSPLPEVAAPPPVSKGNYLCPSPGVLAHTMPLHHVCSYAASAQFHRISSISPVFSA